MKGSLSIVQCLEKHRCLEKKIKESKGVRDRGGIFEGFILSSKVTLFTCLTVFN